MVEPGIFTVPPPEVTKKAWLATGVFNFGATPEAFDALGSAHGYKMVHCERSGANCFLVRLELFSEAELKCVPPVVQLRQPPRHARAWPYGCHPPDDMTFYELNPSDGFAVKNESVMPRHVKECWNDGNSPSILFPYRGYVEA
eukprot:gnl/TRDRNA2_/TRDRNA2_88247_c1_seq1.p1 gnl/TRDRNA2_/TRDRNA2_88247_c1~~gnl/TRDRNA2_/TRDRNA2_88247_c1_seq1.p1  ORF type:complete len:143 (-),score=24.80 gnl/TRDRNA2_/TRDRNA2_88247_c1_seq1:75-503(-)